MSRRLLLWYALAALALAFWAAVVVGQQKWASPRAWGAFALGVLIPYWAYTGRIGRSEP